MKKIICLLVWILLLLFIPQFYVKVSYPFKYTNSVEKYSNIYNLDKSLVYAVIKTESGFDSNSISKSGAYGLMQILPSTMQYMVGENDKEKLFESDFNIYVGTKYLRYLKNKFDDIILVLCAYNAGEGNVFLWLKNKQYSADGKTLNNIPFKETRDYVKKVLNSQKIYEKLDR